MRNLSMGQLLAEVASMAIKKGMIEEILHEPTQERAAPLQRETRSRAAEPPAFRVVHPTKKQPFRLPPLPRIAENTRPALTGCPHGAEAGRAELETPQTV